MNNKITLVELAHLMAEATSTTKRVCELFLRELFATVSQTLIDGENVKVKGIGTFKVTVVKPRKSVNVVTGQAVEIKSYKKVTFTPEKSLAEAINQPFAQFETVYLNDAMNDERLAEIDKKYPSLFAEEQLGTEGEAKSDEATLEPEPIQDSEPTSEPEPEPEAISEPEPEPVVTEEPVGHRALAAFGVTVESTQEEPQQMPQEEQRPYSKEPLMGIPIDGPSPREPEPPKPEPEPEEDDYFYRPAPRNTFTPTQEQISRQQSTRNRNRLMQWLLPALVIVGLLVWAFTRCGGHNENQQTAVAVADSDTVAVVEEAEVITDTVTSQIVLSTLADKYYGSPWFWVYIYEENKSIISDPNNVRPGTAVVIPPAEKYGIDASSPASLKKAQRLSWEILKGK